MKISRQADFQPITIVIENEEEARAVATIMGNIGDGNNVISRVSGQIYRDILGMGIKQFTHTNPPFYTTGVNFK